MAAEGSRHTAELFAALRAVARTQAISRVVREKDADRIEALIAEANRLMDEAQRRYKDSAPAGPRWSRHSKGLRQADRRV